MAFLPTILCPSSVVCGAVVLAEVFSRMAIKKEGAEEFETFHPVLSLLSYLIKAPLVPPGTPIVNALFAQKQVGLCSTPSERDTPSVTCPPSRIR